MAGKPETKPEPAPRGKAFGPSAVLTPANLVTFARVAAIPPLLYLLFAPGEAARWWALALWIALGLSDTFDGMLARRMGTTTSGAYLDPLADKFAVLGAFGALAWAGRASWIAVSLIAVREAAVSLFRSYASRRQVSIPATPFGKAKTVSQMLAIGVLLLPPADALPWLGKLMIWIAVGFTVASGLDYWRRGAEILARGNLQLPPADDGTIEDALTLGRSAPPEPGAPEEDGTPALRSIHESRAGGD